MYGDFRSSDIKWTTKVYKITEVLLKPGYPPMYLTDADDNVARTKNQLQKVSKKDEEPDARFIRGNPEFYIIAEILDKRINNRKTELLNFVSSLNGHLTIYDSPYGIGLGGWCWITAIYTLFYISIARLFRKYIDRSEIKTDKDRQTDIYCISAHKGE